MKDSAKAFLKQLQFEKNELTEQSKNIIEFQSKQEGFVGVFTNL